jgi:hypothetical protein
MEEVQLREDQKIHFRPCALCLKNYIIKQGQSRFCSKECREKYYNVISMSDEFKAKKKKQKEKREAIARDRQRYEDYKKAHPDE